MPRASAGILPLFSSQGTNFHQPTPSNVADCNFQSIRFWGANDHEAGPSNNDASNLPQGCNFQSTRFWGANDHEAGPSNKDASNLPQGCNFERTRFSTANDYEAGLKIQRTFRRTHNCARNFQNSMTIVTFQLPTLTTCTWCNTRLFYHESRDTCCSSGKVSFSNVSAPIKLLKIFSNASSEGRHFRQHIRSYNHVLSFTSLGVHIDENMIATGRGIYSFLAQGAIYHNIRGFYPNDSCRPCFLQLYIYDIEHELQNRMLENPQLHQTLVYKLQQIFHRYNPFVHVFRQLALRKDVDECSLLIKERPANQPQYNLPTDPQVAAIIVDGDVESMTHGQDINVIRHDGNLIRIQETVGYYDPLQYPLLLPLGTYDWDLNTKNHNGKSISYREYYSYMLQIRPNHQFIRTHQNNIRVEVYQGLQDALHVGETTTENVGQRTILPSSFIGSRRDLTQRYEDGMTFVLNDGKPDISLTMTCNPTWNKISSELGNLQTPQDRPDLLARIFKAKFKQLKEDVVNKGALGKVKSYISSCMKNGKCKKRYPKQFLDDTRQGPDQVAMEVHRGSTLDEVQQYIDARWICALEAFLWNEFYPHMVEDYPSTSTSVSINVTNVLLRDLNDLLIRYGSTQNCVSHCFIWDSCNTITYGRTAHSRFKIPINVEAESFCSISRQSDLAKLIRETIAIIWDKAPMINRYALEALNRSLRDLLNLDAPFGGKVMILGGDFRQVLPVVQKASGHHNGKRAFLPRIKHKTIENAGLSFVFSRKQFPVKLIFAITINKSQGQTIPNVGIYLPRHVFNHGQLYVALSRGVSQATTKILIKEGQVDEEDGNFTKNVVFKEILLSQT
ncbi:hypothetical protein VNO78_19906 [Psophocarpus tetragonolobus]|uniref:ATP-dependent DNA helicase n=1 Tax=Psophocarpus tetragonolobus TaxID=3891 RepID=A0AAN9SAB4_PSOTE